MHPTKSPTSPPLYADLTVRFGCFFPGGFTLNWATKEHGFGQLTFHCDGSIEVKCDNECMSPDFVKAVFSKWVDGMQMTEVG